VRRPGVVHLDVGRDRQGCRQELVLLAVEGVLPLGEKAIELAGGDVDTRLAQLLQEQRLGHVLTVVLVEDEVGQVRSAVAAGYHLGGEGGHQASAVGGQPAFATVEDGAGPEDQILNDEVLVAREDGPLRAVSQREDDLVGDDQLGGLGSLGGAGAFGLGVAGRPRRRFQGTGCDPGSGFEALEADDLVFELVDPFSELLDVVLLEVDPIFESPDAVLIEMMISSNCWTSGVPSASGISGHWIGMTGLDQQLPRHSALGY
jgi:hypothetical protein